MLFAVSRQFVALAMAFTTICLVQMACAMPVTNGTALEDLQARTTSVFLGYTGVETGRAQKYEDGTFFKQATSLVGATLGNGIYLADMLSSVEDYAEEAAERKGTKPMVCYFYATDQNHWIQLKKVWIPKKNSDGFTLWGVAREQLRKKWANMDTSSFIRVAVLPRGGNQMVIPTDMTSGITVKCEPLQSAKEAVENFSYTAMIKPWNVAGYSA